jgi:hypothetical protein
MNRIEIEADRADVLTALTEVLSAEELRAIKIIGCDSANPLDRTPRRARDDRDDPNLRGYRRTRRHGV